MRIEHKTSRTKPSIHCSLPDVVCKDDIIEPQGRAVRIILKQVHAKPTRPFDAVPHFRLTSSSGMAFPEVMRAYARLFAEVADFIEGKEPIDFQI